MVGGINLSGIRKEGSNPGFRATSSSREISGGMEERGNEIGKGYFDFDWELGDIHTTGGDNIIITGGGGWTTLAQRGGIVARILLICQAIMLEE